MQNILTIVLKFELIEILELIILTMMIFRFER
nr:MAG TPA: hypothetical protein [Caudoviricetes sp.]